MKKILHITTHLGGGPGRLLLNTAFHSTCQGKFSHEIICLDYANDEALELASKFDLNVIDKAEHNVICEKAKNADIVHIDWWNHPLMFKFLCWTQLPAVRIMIWAHTSGYQPPHVFSRELINYSDLFVFSTPHSFESPDIKKLPEDIIENKIRMVHSSAGLERVRDVYPKPHDRFNIGYIGTVDSYKIHPDFVRINAAANIPNVKFIVCGGNNEDAYRQQSIRLGVHDKFDFKGYVKDIKSVLENLDIFGYPLARNNYGTTDQALIEAMGAGVPPVVLSYSAERYLVEHGRTGLIAKSEQEYTAALEYLYRNPGIRKKLSENARRVAEEKLSVSKTTKNIEELYDAMLAKEKRSKFPLSGKFFPTPRSTPSGAQIFVTSLGNWGRPFYISMSSSNDEEILMAEKSISESSKILRAPTRGSIRHYKKFFPRDIYLNLWSALVLLKDGKYNEALDLLNLIEEKYNHWRIFWYRAQAAKRAGRDDLYNRDINRVLSLRPDLETEMPFDLT